MGWVWTRDAHNLEKNHVRDAEKAFDKILQLLLIKTLGTREEKEST